LGALTTQVSAAHSDNPLVALGRRLGLVSDAEAAGPAAGGQAQQITVRGLPQGGNVWVEVQAVNGAARQGGNLGAISNSLLFNASSGSGTSGGSGPGGSGPGSSGTVTAPGQSLPNTSAGSQAGVIILLGLALLTWMVWRSGRSERTRS